MTDQNYDANDMQHLEGLSAVRKRVGMFLGDSATKGRTHTVFEIIDNSVDEAIAGYCKNITVTIREDESVEVVDDGRGIPTAVHKKTGLPAVIAVFTLLHFGGKFGGSGYKSAGGLHGVGSSVVNATASRLDFEVFRDGEVVSGSFQRGKLGTFKGDSPDSAFVPAKSKSELRAVRKMKKGESTGTKVVFWSDPTIFLPDAKIDVGSVRQKMRQTAFLVPGLSLTLNDHISHPGEVVTETFMFEGGIEDMVDVISHDAKICDTVHIQGKGSFKETVPMLNADGELESTEVERTVDVDVALRWGNGYDTHVNGFVNVVSTPKGGTHLKGFQRALVQTLRKSYDGTRLLKSNEDPPILEDFEEGLTAVVSVGVAEPQFVGQTKEELGTAGVNKVVYDVVSEGLKAWVNGKKKSQVRKVLEKVANASKVRVAHRTQKEAARRKTALEGASMPAKLVDCRATQTAGSEIFIVEGDSALGCFTADTLVKVAHGKDLTFEQLVKDWELGIKHYGYATDDNGNVVIAELEHPRVTKTNATIVEVALDNGKKMRCTPDHLFLMRDGSYREAEKLQPHDSLMPLYLDTSGLRELVWHNGTQRWGSVNDLYVPKFQDANFSKMRRAGALSDKPAALFNHKVEKVTKLNTKETVYDLTVEKYHNFALSSGVFVHNSARQGRNSEFQALLPLRGKILNTQKASLKQMLDNAECAAMIQVIGAGSGRSFDVEQMRYDRLVLMTDADVDGSHIFCLAVTFVNKYMKPIIEEGKLFAALPPLYKVETTGRNPEKHYVYRQEELDTLLTKLKKEKKNIKFPIQRYKGLGEMDAEELWETTMDPSTRRIRRISMSDVDEAENMLELLMGSDVSARRDFLVENFDKVENLDI